MGGKFRSFFWENGCPECFKMFYWKGTNTRTRPQWPHDSYERLVEVDCDPSEHFSLVTKTGIEPIGDQIENPTSIGALSKNYLKKQVRILVFWILPILYRKKRARGSHLLVMT